MIEEALYTILTAAATTAGDRIYPLVLIEEPTLPAVVYQRVSTDRIRSMTGVSGLAYPRYQFMCWADSYEAAKILADEVRTALEDYAGTVGAIVIQHMGSRNELDIYEPQTARYGVMSDFMVALTE